ncbi:MAG: hypothetical protein LBB68_03625 [Treponema sp.]|jgi:4-deoxy-L-threo-5-hexosulose-uronate ketol-isomerase|nr:hypothetical protein [Treponema sp.]
MKLEIRYAEHPGDVKQYGTEELRNHFLCEKVFFEDEIHLCYTHSDRVVFGGAFPVEKKPCLEGGKDFGSDVFLDRRELGIICIVETGIVTVDGKDYPMKKGDGLYVGKGTGNVTFSATGGNEPPRRRGLNLTHRFTRDSPGTPAEYTASSILSKSSSPREGRH